MLPSLVPQRRLGEHGPFVSAIGLGQMAMTHAVYGPDPSDEERFALLDRALELGVTFWDSSDLYQGSEILIGKWLERTRKRDDIFIASKFGFVQGSKTLEVNTTASYCKQCCDQSLKKLGVDAIDLYYAHSVNPDTPIEETMRALAELKAEGKIKNIGLSSVTSTTLRRAVKIARVAAVQTEYTIFSREIEGPEGTDLLAACCQLGVAVVVAMPLGRGLLTSTFRQGGSAAVAPSQADIRPKMMPRFLPANHAQNTEVLVRLGTLADKKGCSISQLALAWLLKQGDNIIPIPGTKQLKYLEENAGAVDFPLTDAEEVEVRDFAERAALAGGTMPEKFESYRYRDTRAEY